MKSLAKVTVALMVVIGITALAPSATQADDNLLAIGKPKITYKSAGENKLKVRASIEVELLGAKATYTTPEVTVIKNVPPPPLTGSTIGVSFTVTWKWTGNTLTCTAVAKASAAGKTLTVQKSASTSVSASVN